MLAQTLALKGQALDHVLPTKPAASEMSFGKVSVASAIAEHEFVYILPFNMPTTSTVTRRGVESASGSVNTGLVRCSIALALIHLASTYPCNIAFRQNKCYGIDTRAVKQEYFASVSDRLNVKMKIQAIIKQIVSGSRSILLWEGLIQ